MSNSIEEAVESLEEAIERNKGEINKTERMD